MSLENLTWDLKVTWQKPVHVYKLFGYSLYRKNVGLIDRGGYCLTQDKIIEEACQNGWVSACEETKVFGERIKTFDDLNDLEYTDTVDEYGVWRYAVFARHSSHPSRPAEGKETLTLCSTNTFFVKETFTLNVVSEQGTINGSFRASYGDEVELEVSEVNHGYEFDGWESDDYDIVNPESKIIKVIVTKDLTITAKYKKIQYYLRVNGYQGSVDKSVDGFYDYLSIVNINAVAGEHNIFKSWQGEEIDTINDANTDVLITDDLDLLALFELKKYKLDLITQGNGTVVGSGEFPYNSVVPISAEPGYNQVSLEPQIFNKWEEQTDGNVRIFNPGQEGTYVRIYSDATIKAYFEEDFYLIKVKGEHGIEEGTGTYESEIDITISAEPNRGYRFDEWTVEGLGTVLDDREKLTKFRTDADNSIITANYKPIDYTIKIEGEGGKNTIIFNEQAYNDSYVFNIGNKLIIKAEPDEGVKFVRWDLQGNGEIEDIYNPDTIFTVDNSDCIITAVYEIMLYDIYLEADNALPEINDTSSYGKFKLGDVININANPRRGYFLGSWSVVGPGKLDAETSLITKFTVGLGHATIKANIVQKLYNFNAFVKKGLGDPKFRINGEDFSSAELGMGEEIELISNPSQGYSFSSWSVEGGILFKEGGKTYLLTEDRDAIVYATYNAKPVSITSRIDYIEG
jgi:uncharacterized repeat protein (TIGR02543 family)